MPSIEVKAQFDGISPTDCYNAAEESVETLGFSFVKKRPLGWFLQLKKDAISCNLSIRPGVNTTATFALSGDSETEESLKEIAEQFEAAIRQKI